VRCGHLTEKDGEKGKKKGGGDQVGRPSVGAYLGRMLPNPPQTKSTYTRRSRQTSAALSKRGQVEFTAKRWRNGLSERRESGGQEFTHIH